MTTPFPEWLSGLGSVRADLPKKGAEPITRGLAKSFTISYPGDVTAATLQGQIKASPDASTALANFTIGTPSVVSGRTIWEFSLAAGSGAGSTGSLPSDDDASGTESFYYDLLLTLPGGTAQRVAAGLFTVTGQITEPA